MSQKNKRPLFRQEALDAQTMRHGQVVLVRPVSFSVFVVFLILILLLASIYLFTASFTKTVQVQGVIKTSVGATEVFAHQQGVIEQLFVEEGQQIVVGTPLYSIRTDQEGVDGSINNQLIAELKTSLKLVEKKISFQEQLIILETSAVEQEVQTQRANAKRIQDEILLQDEYIAVLSSELSSMDKLLVRKQISQTDYNAKYVQLIEARMRKKSFLREKNELLEVANAASNKLENIKLQGESLITNYQQTISDLKRQLASHKAEKSYLIKAPSTGVIANIFYQQGHFAETNTPLMTLLPVKSELVAEIYIPSQAISRVWVKQSLNIRYQAFPYQEYGLYEGTISSISKTLIEPRQAEIDSLITEPSYRAIVSLHQQSIQSRDRNIHLQTGMLLNADIVGEQRTLIAWIFEPLAALTQDS